MSKRKAFIAAVIAAIMLFGIVSTAVAAIPRYSASYNKSKIRGVAQGKIKGTYSGKYYHYSDYQTKCLLKLAYRESSYRNWVTNGSCRGLFQLSGRMSYRKPWWRPVWNTDRALVYIRARYGTPSKALAHSYRRGWY